MIIFDVRAGRFSLLALRETVQHSFKITREGPGEIIFDLPFASLTFTNHRTGRVAQHSQPTLTFATASC